MPSHSKYVQSQVMYLPYLLAASLPADLRDRFRVVSDPPFISYDSLPRGYRKSGRRMRRPTFSGNCSASPAAARAWIRQSVWPFGLNASARSASPSFVALG